MNMRTAWSAVGVAAALALAGWGAPAVASAALSAPQPMPTPSCPDPQAGMPMGPGAPGMPGSPGTPMGPNMPGMPGMPGMPMGPGMLFGPLGGVVPQRGMPGPNQMPPGMGEQDPMGGHMMHSAMCDARSEFDYLAHMIPHHAEAVEAARNLARSARPEMREFGARIVATQSAEIAEMRRWLHQWYPDRSADVTYHPMMRDLSGLSGDDLDKAFLDDMIPHHQHAVMMSQYLLQHGLAEHDQVEQLARSIRDTQRDEIAQMREWRQEWFGPRHRAGAAAGTDSSGAGMTSMRQ